MTQRSMPWKDGEGELECQHCGGSAHSRVGGEHIWKCSEVVPRELLEDLLAEWRAKEEWHREQSIKNATGGQAWQTFRECANDLEELLE